MSIPAYIRIARLDHWIKNTLIFIPLFFSAGLFNVSLIAGTVFGFICFSLLSSIVYILNDIRDMEKDRLHSSKCRRPLASGESEKKMRNVTSLRVKPSRTDFKQQHFLIE
jgi:4-hydroxybenzoate polyprenyltransferase